MLLLVKIYDYYTCTKQQLNYVHSCLKFTLLFDSLSCYTALHVFSREVHCSCVLVSFCLILAGSINLWRKNVSELTQEIWLQKLAFPDWTLLLKFQTVIEETE